MKKKAIEIPDMIPGARENRNWQNAVNQTNDISQLKYQLAVYSTLDKKIYKLSCLDYRGGRYDVSDLKMTKYITLQNGILFNFTTELDTYFLPEFSTMSKTEIFQWLSESAGSISVGTQ